MYADLKKEILHVIRMAHKVNILPSNHTYFILILKYLTGRCSYLLFHVASEIHQSTVKSLALIETR